MNNVPESWINGAIAHDSPSVSCASLRMRCSAASRRNQSRRHGIAAPVASGDAYPASPSNEYR